MQKALPILAALILGPLVLELKDQALGLHLSHMQIMVNDIVTGLWGALIFYLVSKYLATRSSR